MLGQPPNDPNSISITETTMRNNLLNQEIEESMEEGQSSSSAKDSSPKKKHTDFESPFKQQSAQKSQELSEAQDAIATLKDEIAAVAEAIALSNYSAEVGQRPKRLTPEMNPKSRPGHYQNAKSHGTGSSSNYSPSSPPRPPSSPPFRALSTTSAPDSDSSTSLMAGKATTESEDSPRPHEPSTGCRKN